MNDLTNKIIVNIAKGYESDLLTDNEMVQIIELCFDLLNLQTYQQAANDLGKSYNGIKNHHPNRVSINGNKFVINNV